MLTFGHCLPLAGFLSQRWSSMLPSAFVSVGIATSLLVLMWWTSCQTSCSKYVDSESDLSGDLSDDELVEVP